MYYAVYPFSLDSMDVDFVDAEETSVYDDDSGLLRSPSIA
jgi:hypothetical protein